MEILHPENCTLINPNNTIDKLITMVNTGLLILVVDKLILDFRLITDFRFFFDVFRRNLISQLFNFNTGVSFLKTLHH
jgi:hypothetical protein